MLKQFPLQGSLAVAHSLSGRPLPTMKLPTRAGLRSLCKQHPELRFTMKLTSPCPSDSALHTLADSIAGEDAPSLTKKRQETIASRSGHVKPESRWVHVVHHAWTLPRAPRPHNKRPFWSQGRPPHLLRAVPRPEHGQLLPQGRVEDAVKVHVERPGQVGGRQRHDEVAPHLRLAAHLGVCVCVMDELKWSASRQRRCATTHAAHYRYSVANAVLHAQCCYAVLPAAALLAQTGCVRNARLHAGPCKPRTRRAGPPWSPALCR